MPDKTEEHVHLDTLLIDFRDNNHHESLEEVLTIIVDGAYRIALNKCQNESDAADAVQEASIALVYSVSTYRKGGNVRSWFYSITLNKCRSHIRSESRRRHREQHVSEHIGQTATQTQKYDLDITEQLQHALSTLSELYRTPVWLRYVEERSFSEISNILDIPERTARTRVSRALDQLRSTAKGSTGGVSLIVIASLLPQLAHAVEIPCRLVETCVTNTSAVSPSAMSSSSTASSIFKSKISIAIMATLTAVLFYVLIPAASVPAITQNYHLRTDAVDRISSWPAAAGKHVIIGDATGFVKKVNPKNGKVIWAHRLGSYTPIMQQPLVDNTYIAVIIKHTHKPWELCALHADTGKKIWSYIGIAPGTRVCTSADKWFFATVYNSIIAVHKKDGYTIWETAFADHCHSPLSKNGYIYFADVTGHFFKLDMASGVQLATGHLSGYPSTQPPIYYQQQLWWQVSTHPLSDTQLYQTASLKDSKFVVNQRIHQQHTGFRISLPLLHPTHDASLQAVNIVQFKTTHHVPLHAPYWSPAALNDGILCVQNCYGNVETFDLEQHAVLWHIEYSQASPQAMGVANQPSILKYSFLIHSPNGELQQLDAISGHLLKTFPAGNNNQSTPLIIDEDTISVIGSYQSGGFTIITNKSDLEYLPDGNN